jgi:hypothetical protein
MNKILIATVIVLATIAILIVGPLLVLWALNQLFPVLGLPYTIWNWLAVVILGTFVRAKVSIRKNG